MKARGLGFLSVLLNIALLGAVAVLWQRPSSAPVPTPPAPVAARGGTNAAATPRPRATTGTEPTLVPTHLDWRELESEDYRKYISNLRAINCPEETIRDIIIADVNKMFGSRRSQIEVTPREHKWWQAEEMRQWDDPVLRERQRKIQELEFERRALIKDLLGVDYQQETQKMIGGSSVLDRMYGFLPPDKRERVQALIERSSLIEQELYQEADGDLSPEQRSQLKKLRAETRAQLAQTMSPAELEEYDLRNSPSAHAIRANLAGVELTADEFKAVFRLRKAFDEQFEDGADGPERESAKKQLEDQMRTALGGARFAEFQRAQDPDFQNFHRVTERYQLPTEAAVKLYDLKRTALESRLKLETNSQIIGEQRYAAIEAIAAEVQRSVKEVLGDKGYKYLLSRGGEWMLKPGE
ncbi:hypothetical protein LBMAG56_03940 [Verrucomicrobiota bacterium]|nr:hypothetical protein LBMAG56_03940 [Verrucomicrobiota bacterium]